MQGIACALQKLIFLQARSICCKVLFSNTAISYTIQCLFTELVVFLKYFTISVRFCTSCCSTCLFTSAACIINFDWAASSSTRCFSSVTLIVWSCNSLSSVAILSLSLFNCLITVVKLILRLKISSLTILTKPTCTSRRQQVLFVMLCECATGLTQCGRTVQLVIIVVALKCACERLLFIKMRYWVLLRHQHCGYKTVWKTFLWFWQRLKSCQKKQRLALWIGCQKWNW